VFTFTDCGTQLTVDRPECAVDSADNTSIPTHPRSHSSRVPASSFTSPCSLDIVETGGSYSGTMPIHRSGRSSVDEDGLNSFSYSTRLEQLLKSHNVDYHGPVSTHNRSDSVLPSSCHRLISEPHTSWYGLRKPQTAVSHEIIRCSDTPSFEDNTMDDYASALPAARSYSHSPISKYRSEPASSQSYLASTWGDISHSRRLRSPETRSSVDISIDHHCRVLSIPRTHTHSPVSRYGVPSSSRSTMPASDDGWGFGSSSDVVDQSACNRKRQHQQPVGISSSHLFANKLAKLRTLRYTLPLQCRMIALLVEVLAGK